MEAASSVELACQVEQAVGLNGQNQHQTKNKNKAHQSRHQQHLVCSESQQYQCQETTSADVLSQEDDFLYRLEDEEALDDMTPDINHLQIHRRNSSPQETINKKSNKPMMEKKRRQRINRCLSDLKILVLEAMKKDPSRYSKLEKADILEMTVRHLQMLHKQESVAGRMMANGRIIGGDDISKYRAGFSQCAVEVTKYLATMDDVPHDLHTKVFSHLSSMAPTTTNNINSNATCVQNSVNVIPNPAPIILVVNNTPSTQTPITHVSTQPINYQENAGNSLGAQPIFAQVTSPCATIPVQQQVNRIQIMPTRLNNGDLALVLPATTSLPIIHQNKEVRQSPSAALQASAPVLSAILTSDRNHNSPSSTYVQPPALSTCSEDSALGSETLDISDSDLSSGISTPMSSSSSASSPLPGEEAGGMSPMRASTSRSNSPPKARMWSSSCFREELSSTACSSQNVPRRHQVIAPKPSHPWPPRSNFSDPHKRKKANTPPPPDDDGQSMWRPWH